MNHLDLWGGGGGGGGWLYKFTNVNVNRGPFQWPTRKFERQACRWHTQRNSTGRRHDRGEHIQQRKTSPLSKPLGCRAGEAGSVPESITTCQKRKEMEMVLDRFQPK